MLVERLAERDDVPVWLVNTGWTGGPYGTGERMNIAHTRSMVRAALDGALDDVPTRIDPNFGVEVPMTCPDVPDAFLDPRATWADPRRLRPGGGASSPRCSRENFADYADGRRCGAIAAAGPAAGAPQRVFGSGADRSGERRRPARDPLAIGELDVGRGAAYARTIAPMTSGARASASGIANSSEEEAEQGQAGCERHVGLLWAGRGRTVALARAAPRTASGRPPRPSTTRAIVEPSHAASTGSGRPLA